MSAIIHHYGPWLIAVLSAASVIANLRVVYLSNKQIKLLDEWRRRREGIRRP